MPSEARRRENVVREDTHVGWRLDRYLAEHLRLFSRSQIRHRLVEVRVNSASAKLSRKLHLKDRIEVVYTDPPEIELLPEDIPLDVLHEDGSVLVVNKPQGMVVHPGCGHPNHTLVNAVLHHFREMPPCFDAEDLRPGIVHRLDKDTSGVIIVAKSPLVHEMLAAQFKNRLVRKVYIAILAGFLPASRGVLRTRIVRDPHDRKRFVASESEGKLAVTHYRELRRIGAYSLVALAPRTGRTHQLRVHARHLGAPVAGDPIYGRRRGGYEDPGAIGLMLHSYRLKIRIPGMKPGEIACYTAPLPERFTPLLSGDRPEGSWPPTGDGG